MNSQNIANLLAECLEIMETTGLTAEQAASKYPGHQNELLEMLHKVILIESINFSGPSEEFNAAARTRMINRIKALEANKKSKVVTNQSPPRQIRQNQKLTRRLSMTWIIVIGLLAATLAGGSGVAYASSDALPGDALYPVKTTLQDLELTFSDDEGDIDLLLDIMDQNIQELHQLAQLGRFDDMGSGIEEYSQNFKVLTQTQSRLNYEDAGTEESLNQRIQTQLMTHTQSLEQLKLQTQQQEKIQQKLKEAIQLTDTGHTFGPNDGGKPEEPGQPNGAGPGEQQDSSKPEDAGNGEGQGKKPEDSGSGQSSKPEDAGNGEGQDNKPEDAGNGGSNEGKGCQQTEEGEVCKPEDIGYVCTENEVGELICESHSGNEGYFCQKTSDGEIICKPEQPGNGNGGGQNGPGSGGGSGGKP